MRRLSAMFLTVPFLIGSTLCADMATYRLTFEATWTDAAVSGEHFSGLVGGTHDGSIAFWQTGELATLGIKRMAELGSKTVLLNEVNSHIAMGNAGAVISGPGAGSPGSATVTFTVTDEFPLATVVTMIAPSPDWFAGVSGLSLMGDDGWLQTVDVVLLPYDAGTDSGAFFTSPNQPTVPPDVIGSITDELLFNPLAVGSFRFDRLTDCNDDGQFDVDEIAADPGLDLNENGILDSCECRADIVGDDQQVSTPDLLALLSNWGTDGIGSDIAAPFDIVNVVDLLAMLDAWGRCP